MNILVDHGSAHNMGDTAMLEGVVDRLLSISNDYDLHVFEAKGLRTSIWGRNHVHAVDMRVPLPEPPVSYLNRVPYLWRYKSQLKKKQGLRKAWLRYMHTALDRLQKAADVQVEVGSERVALGQWCRAYDALHVVGGGNLTDVFPAQLWKRCCLIYAFAAQGKPVFLSGQQIGPFHSSQTKKSLQRALRKASFVGIREPTDSLVFCEQARLKPNRYAVMGDDSFGCAAAPDHVVQALMSRYRLTSDGFLAANIRIGKYAQGHAKHTQRYANLLAALSQKYDLPIVVVPIALNESDSDIESGYRLREAVGGDRVQVIDDTDLTPALIKSVLGQSRAAVGVSYHFCTFALSQNVPAVCVYDGAYYGQKAKGLGSFWEDERIVLPLDLGDAESMLRQVSNLVEDQGFRDNLGERAAAASQKWHQIFDAQAHELYSRSRSRAA